MKFNFRKITAIGASLLMAGMTAGMAAAANFPGPFVDNAVADVAVVYGTGAGVSDLDMVQAGSIQTTLGEAMPATGGTTTTGGESFKFEKSSTKYHLGDNVTEVVSSSMNDDKLPTLLADGKYLDKLNEEFDYTQKIEMNATLDLTMWENQDYIENEPTVGFQINSGDTILTYTLDFTDNPEVENMDTTDLPIMGKTYYVLTNTTGGDTITLLNSAESTILSEGETGSMTIEDITYTSKVEYISSTAVKLEVNGEITNSLAAAATYKLSDGSYVGIKEIMYDGRDGGISKVEYSIGSGKLKLTNSSNVQINDNSVAEITSVITADTNSKLTSISLVWAAEEDVFVTEDTSILMPEFEAVRFSYGGLTYPTEEIIQVQQGGETYAILNDFPLKDGEVDIPFLYGLTDATAGTNFTGIGKDATHKLVTSNLTTLNYTKSTDWAFIASYVSGDDAESYLIRPTNFLLDGSNDEVDFEYYTNGAWTSLKKGLKLTSTLAIGNVELTVGPVTSTGATSNKTVGLTAGTSMNFDELYSAEGLKIYLPVDSTTNFGGSYNSTPGHISFNQSNTNWTTGHNGTAFYLTMVEEDKDGAIGSNAPGFNISIGWDSSTTPEVEVSDVWNESATFKEIQDTNVWKSFMYSSLATEFLLNKPSSGQDSVKIIYHGGEVAADVYITSPETTVASGNALGEILVKDSEIDSMKTKNLIVVGGSCINSVAANLLGSACGPSFTEATGVGTGQFLIQSFGDAYTTGKIALLVAGYGVADTGNAATYLRTQTVDTTAGNKYIGTSSTEATLQTAQA